MTVAAWIGLMSRKWHAVSFVGADFTVNKNGVVAEFNEL